MVKIFHCYKNSLLVLKLIGASRKLFKLKLILFTCRWAKIKDAENRLNKHDKFVLKLCDAIQNEYNALHVNVPLRSKKRLMGEIDVCGIRKDAIDLYEVKCAYREHKAKKQLARARKLLGLNNGCRTFFYCGEAGLLIQIEDKTNR